MNTKDFRRLLQSLHACSEAIEWASDKDLSQVWEQCPRGDWLLWLSGKMADKPGWPTRKDVVLAACACAERALKYVRKGEERPRIAIETARRWAQGQAEISEVRAAAAAAYAADAAAADDAAAAAAASAAAAYASDASAYDAAAAAAASAGAAAAAAYASDASAYDAAAAYASDAAYAAYAAARTQSLLEEAQLVRFMLHFAKIEEEPDQVERVG